MPAKPPYELTQPPDGIGQLTDLFTTNCAPEPWVYVGAVGWGLLSAFFSLLSPSWKDWVKWSNSTEFELKWSGIEGKDGRSWLHGGRWILEGAEEKEASAYIKGLGYLFDIGEFVDAEAFWFFVGQAVSQGVLAGTSLIMQQSPCQRPVNFHGFWSKLNFTNLEITHDWQPAGAWRGVDQDGNSGLQGYLFNVPQGATATLFYHMAYNFSEFPVPVAFNTRVRDWDTGDIYWQNDWNPEKADPHYSNFGYLKPFGPTKRAYTLVTEVQIIGTIPVITGEIWPNHLAFEYTTPVI